MSLTFVRDIIPDDEFEVSRCFLTEKGNIPLLIVSGHGGRFPLNSVPKRTSQHANTVRDDNANVLTENLVKALRRIGGDEFSPFSIQALCHRKYCDLNRSESEACEHPLALRYYRHYHGLIAQYLSEIQALSHHHFAILIDVHGQAWKKDSILRGTKDGATVARLLKRYGPEALVGENSMFGLLQAQGYPIFPPTNVPIGLRSPEREPKNFSGGWTVRYWSGEAVPEGLEESHRSIFVDSIQVEVGYKYRESDEAIQLFAEDWAHAIIKWMRASFPPSSLGQ
jgi:hypothetical protein